MNKNTAGGINSLKAFDKDGELNVIIETPKGSRNKYTFDEEHQVFRLGGILPLGASFPFDFGFIPNTLGGDGDPLDVLVLMDGPAFAGCLIPSKLIGVIQANQTERDGKVARNDRLIAVASESKSHKQVKNLNDLSESVIGEIKHFFISYNEAKGKEFEPIGQFGATRAKNIVEEGVKKHAAKQREKKSRAVKKK